MPTPLKPVAPATAAGRLDRLHALVRRGPSHAFRRDLDALRWLLGEYDRLTRGLDPDPFPGPKAAAPLPGQAELFPGPAQKGER